MSTTASPTASFSLEQLQPTSSPSQHDSSILSQSTVDDVPLHGPDTEKHPKGKRKRTAAKDKMILEGAYRCNPKPDKQARQEIVDRVSLNEKEVQIWFQNRRQNDRRKSRPLSPEELAALRFGGMHHVTSDSVASRSSMVNLEIERPFSSSDPANARPIERGLDSPTPTKTRPELVRSYSEAAIASPRHHGASSAPNQNPELLWSRNSEGGAELLSRSFPNTVGYLANRWNTGSSFSSPSTLGCRDNDTLRLETFHPPSCSSDKSGDAQSKSQSQVRLSLSLEGKAELVSDRSSSASPLPTGASSSLLQPGPQPRQRGGLTRSLSALPSITLPPISTLTNSLPPRLARGRSRDVQAWESCADSERRDELTAQAQHESNGSAIAAISLLRSSSGVLQSSSTKRNASLATPQQPRQAKKAKMGITSSNLAGSDTGKIVSESGKSGDLTQGKVKVSMLISPTDSDKENWSPDEDGNPEENPQRRPLPAEPSSKSQNPRRRGRALRDQGAAPKLGARANTAPTRPLAALKGNATIDIFEDGGSPRKTSREDDVEKFMRGEVSPSKRPDMDCVAGLLSLSQGAWR